MIVACIYISIYLNIFIGINTVMGGATWPDLLGNQSKYDCIEISKTFALVMNWWAVPLQPLNFIVASPWGSVIYSVTNIAKITHVWRFNCFRSTFFAKSSLHWKFFTCTRLIRVLKISLLWRIFYLIVFLRNYFILKMFWLTFSMLS